MTAANKPPFKQYQGDGVTVGFAAEFRFNAPSHIHVRLIAADGSFSDLAYGTDYSVTGGVTDAGGTVTMIVAPPIGSRLQIRRITPRDQSMNYTTTDTFPAESHEAAIDKAMLVDQEQDVAIDDLGGRALLVPVGETSAELPSAADRANQTLGFDAIGRPIPLTPGGADGALRGDLADDGGVMIGTDGDSTAQDDINGIRGPWPIGAAGDGVTNDKLFIDAVNLAGQEVDLMGRDYAYTGTVDLTKARFRNGRIISSTMGTLDFRQTLILFTKQVTVGAAGQIKRGEYVMPYLRQLRIVGEVDAICLEQNTPNDATGSMAFNAADFYHPDMIRIFWKSATLALVPTAAEMPGRNMTDLAAAKAADLAFLLTRFSASMYFTGTDDLNGIYGLSAVGGFNAENLLLENHTRYNTSVNWLGSHSNKMKGGGRISLINCASNGGVWPLTMVDAHVVFGGARVMLSYPLNGGGFFAEHCTFYKSGTTELHIYHPKVTPNSNLPKYGFQAQSCHFLWEPDGFNVNKIFIFGPFLHGLYLIDCTGAIPDVSYDGVTQLRTQVGGSMEYGRPKARNSDPANTALTQGAVQPGIIGNPVSGALFFVSAGGTARYRGVDVAACVCASYFVADSGGKNICGLNAKEDIDDSKATTKAYRALASRGNLHRPNITNPRSGTIDGAGPIFGSDMFFYDNAGVSPDITVNIWDKGNLVSTA